MYKVIGIFLLLIASVSSNATEVSPKTKIMIEHPWLDVVSYEEAGIKSKFSRVEITGYKLELVDEKEHLFMIPTTKLSFTSSGLLESSAYESRVETRQSWQYDNGKLLSTKQERLDLNGKLYSARKSTYLYDEYDNLYKIVVQNMNEHGEEISSGCLKFIFKDNLVRSRGCHTNSRLALTFNDNYKITNEESREVTNGKKGDLISSKYEYSDGLLKSKKSYLFNELIFSVSFTHHENGAMKSKTEKNIKAGIVISSSICTYDNNENETSCIHEKEKPKNHNPIFGEFIAKSMTRTEHVQKNDKFGNPISRSSTFYSIDDQNKETLLKKEYRQFSYQY